MSQNPNILPIEELFYRITPRGNLSYTQAALLFNSLSATLQEMVIEAKKTDIEKHELIEIEWALSSLTDTLKHWRLKNPPPQCICHGNSNDNIPPNFRYCEKCCQSECFICSDCAKTLGLNTES